MDQGKWTQHASSSSPCPKKTFNLYILLSPYFFFHFHFTACSSESKSFPYLCLDATFIVTLFKEGYGFSDDRPLTVGVVDVLFL